MKYLRVKGALGLQLTLKWLRKNNTDVVMSVLGGWGKRPPGILCIILINFL